MIHLIMDSTCGITFEEARIWGMDLLPMRIAFGNEDLLDLQEIPAKEFFDKVEKGKAFPKTSLPSIETAMNLAKTYTDKGEDVLFVTLSSAISSTFSALYSAFSGEEKVLVVDSQLSAPGMRILAQEILKHKDDSLKEAKARIDALVPRIKIFGIPSSLEYLHRGGRVNSIEFIGAKILGILPILTFADGKLTSYQKVHGMKQGMKILAKLIETMKVDIAYPFIAAYTKTKTNLESFLAKIPDVKVAEEIELPPSLMTHWGPDAFGFAFVTAE